jgi:hypothetical protein
MVSYQAAAMTRARVGRAQTGGRRGEDEPVDNGDQRRDYGSCRGGAREIRSQAEAQVLRVPCLLKLRLHLSRWFGRHRDRYLRIRELELWSWASGQTVEAVVVFHVVVSRATWFLCSAYVLPSR